MHGRKLDVRWTLVVPVFALAVVAVVLFANRGTGEAPAHTQAVPRTPYVSRTLGSREFRAAPAPTLAESLQAADILVKAGVITPPQPSLMDALRAADLLVKAGALAPPAPSLGDSIIAADALVKAGVIDPPAPSLIDSLRAAVILHDAKAAQARAAAQPPSPPVPSTSAPVPPAAPQSAVAAAETGPGGYYDDAFTGQVFALVNQRRQGAGLQPVSVEPRLARSAAAYTKVLADNNWFSHTGPDGSTLVTRDEAAGFPFTVQLGEVLAWGSNGWTPAEIVQAWINSPPHREQILSPAYNRAGTGCYFTHEDTLMVRCAMEFAAPD